MSLSKPFRDGKAWYALGGAVAMCATLKLIQFVRGGKCPSSSSSSSSSTGEPDATFNVVDVIAAKRDGKELSQAQIEWFVGQFNAGHIADYQMSALLMAIYVRGMNDTETASLTVAMANSGTVADWSSLPEERKTLIDKHSTGGVGDKVSLILAPLVASCGVISVPMMSGRGLGHTGGTLDKLESIPGFQTAWPSNPNKFLELVAEVGCAIVGPTKDIAPVDKRIYALRDVTGTTESLPLLCSSIMSKKIAENPHKLLLDVKYGNGAFLKEMKGTYALAEAMIGAGNGAGKETTVIVTNMDQPLGRCVGNWLEVRESIEVLSGQGPADVRAVVVAQAAQMFVAGNAVETYEQGLALAKENLNNGKALDYFKRMVAAQGGDVSLIDHPDQYGEAKHSMEFVAPQDGVITFMDTAEIGWSMVMLGAGRKVISDQIDYKAGSIFHKKLGDRVVKGESIATLYASNESLFAAVQSRLQAAIRVEQREGFEQPQLIKEFMAADANGIVQRTPFSYNL